MDLSVALSQHVPCGLLLVDADDLIIEANDRMASMLGRHPADLPGNDWLSLVSPAARLMHHTYVAPLLKLHGRVDEVSLPWVAADGGIVDTLMNAAAATWEGRPATWLAVFRLRERRQLEEQLLHAKRVVEQVPGLLFLMRRAPDQKWTFLYASEAVRKLFGVTPLQALATPSLIWRTVHPEDAPVIQSALNASGDQLVPFRVEYRVSVNGVELWHETHATPQREPDGGVLWHGYTSDITERKTVEAVAREREAAQQASRAKSTFLARVSHELRTPLNGILGFSRLMLMDRAAPLTPDQQRKLGYIAEAGETLLRLINEVMDISRIETGHIALNTAELPLLDVVREAVRMTEPMAMQHGVRVSLSGGDGGQRVRVDAHRLTQILINLLSNALKYGPQGGQVDVTVSTAAPDQVCVTVADQGPGLAPEQQAQLYQPFNRLGAERTTVEGTGLGLVITRGLVELMDGRLTLDSAPGQGARFTVHLPLLPSTVAARRQGVPVEGSPVLALAEPVARSSPAIQAVPPAAAPTGARVRAKVLYVEDNPVNLLLMESVLARRPAIELLRATTGAAALEVVRQVRPDILLLDIHLPDTDGVSLLRDLRATQPGLVDVPAVAVSADALSEDIDSALSQGFAAYWTKPLDVAQVLSRMDALLRDQGAVGGTMSA